MKERYYREGLLMVERIGDFGERAMSPDEIIARLNSLQRKADLLDEAAGLLHKWLDRAVDLSGGLERESRTFLARIQEKQDDNG